MSRDRRGRRARRVFVDRPDPPAKPGRPESWPRHRDLLKELIEALAAKGSITAEEQIRLTSLLY